MRRRRNLMIGGAAAIAVIVVALLVLASIVSKIFGNVGGGLNKDELGLNGPGSSSSSSSASSAAAGSVVKPRGPRSSPPTVKPTTRARRAGPSMAAPPRAGKPTSTPTLSRSPASKTVSG